MASNPFDQFDEGNAFDQFDAAPARRSAASEVGRQVVGLPLRAGIQGLTDLVNAPADFATYLYNLGQQHFGSPYEVTRDGQKVTVDPRTQPLRTLSERRDEALDRVLPTPETTSEVVANVGLRGLAGSRVPMPTPKSAVPDNYRPELTQTQHTFAKARDAGYVAPPATVKPTVTNVARESLAGKAATEQLASRKNQEVTNELIANDLGIGKGEQITKRALQEIRERAGRVYAAVSRSGKITPDQQYNDEVAALSKVSKEIAQDFPDANIASGEEIAALVKSLQRSEFDTKSAMAYLRELRKQGSANLTAARNAGGDPAKQALGEAQRDAAGAMEDLIIRHLKAQGKGDLAEKFDEARTLIAKSHSAEGALTEATGNIRARDLANLLKRGKPLSGGFRQVGEFAQAFPKAATEQLTSPGVSALDAAYTGGSGLALSTMVDPMAGAAALLWPAARMTARYSALMPWAQNSLLPQAPKAADPRLLLGSYAGSRGLLDQ